MDSPLFEPFLVQTGTATEIATISLHEPQHGKTKIDPIDLKTLLARKHLSFDRISLPESKKSL